MAYTRPAAPGALERIEVFGNSARFLCGEDALADVASARAWLRAHAWGNAADELDEHTRQELLRVREAIRDHIEGEASGQARSTLNEHARSVLLPPRWNADGEIRLPVAESSGVPALVGDLLADLAAEELAGRRGRLKVCRSPECRWLFYDRSPGNSSVWCSMGICGARHKMRAHRTRRSH